jgi:hypothetical protein
MPLSEAFWLALCAGILLWKLLLPGFIGMADNGDFVKVAGRVCLASAEPERESFFHSLYLRTQANCFESHVPTSEFTLAWLASTAERTVGDPNRFDIRWLGAIHGLIFLAFYACLLRLLQPLGGIARLAMSLAALWIFADTGLIAYCNSFYTDTPALLGGLAASVLAVSLLASKQVTARELMLFGLAALLAITSKEQHGMLGWIPAALAFRIGYRAPERRTRIAAHLAGAALLAGTVWVALSTPGWYGSQARFNVVFFRIAKDSLTPLRDLRELGLGGTWPGFI